MRRATSADVAREAGVSRATVSYVLNNTPGQAISDATRDLVLAAARKLGHVPNAPARSLRRGRSDIVMVLVRDFSLPYVLGALLRRLDAAFARRGYVMLVNHYDPELRTVHELWQLISPTLVVAMSGLPKPEQSEISQISERFIRLDDTLPNERIGEIQGRHLVSQGHRVIAYAQTSDAQTALIAARRLNGIRKSLLGHGLAIADVALVDENDPRTIERAVDRWLTDQRVTAVAAHNDVIALMIIDALTARGLRVGHDVAVIGADDIPPAWVSLTTVAIDVDLWAEAAIRMINAILDDERDTLDDDRSPTIPGDILRLVVRSSA